MKAIKQKQNQGIVQKEKYRKEEEAKENAKKQKQLEKVKSKVYKDCSGIYCIEVF